MRALTLMLDLVCFGTRSLITTLHHACIRSMLAYDTCVHFAAVCCVPAGAPVVRATSTTDGSSDGEEHGHRAVVSASAARAPPKDREGFVARVRKAPQAKLPDAPHAF